MTKLVALLKKALEHLTVLLTAIITIIVTLEVFLRGFFDYSIVATDEASPYLMNWIVMLAGGLAALTDEHIRINVTPETWSPQLRRALALGSKALALIFLAVFTYAALDILPGMRGDRTVTLGISMFWIYLALPVGGALMLFATALGAWRLWRERGEDALLARKEK